MSEGFPATRRKGTRSRRDFLLWGLIVGVALLAGALAVPLTQSGRILHAHHDFVQDLTDSALYGRRHGTTTVEVDGQPRETSYDKVSRLIATISSLGMGRPSDHVPDEPGVRVEFGDGSSLSLWQVQITDPGRTADEGVLIRYVRADGDVFSYDTDRLSYEDVLHILG